MTISEVLSGKEQCVKQLLCQRCTIRQKRIGRIRGVGRCLFVTVGSVIGYMFPMAIPGLIALITAI